MPWWQFALLGAAGGAIVEVLAIFRCIAAWQDARRNNDGTVKRQPAKMRDYVDVPAHSLMLPARILLGVAAAVLLGVTRQVIGPYGTVAIGCAAPALLAQLGSIPQVAKAVSSIPETQNQPEQRPAKGTPEAVLAAGESGLR